MKIKLQKIIRINAALAALSLAAALHATTTPATLSVTFTAYDNADDGITGEANNSSTGESISVGELDDANFNRLERALVVFSLPAIQEGETLVSAKLRIYVRSVAVASSPDALLYHSQTSTVTTNYSGLYSAASYTPTGLSVANTSMTASAPEPRLVELDVTSWVKNDYQFDTGTVVSSFRIQMDQDFFEDNVSHRYTFFGKDSATYAPQLILETGPAIPEPGHLTLFVGGIGLLGAIILRYYLRQR